MLVCLVVSHSCLQLCYVNLSFREIKFFKPHIYYNYPARAIIVHPVGVATSPVKFNELTYTTTGCP